MPNMLFANNCNTTLNGGITAGATSMVVTSATGFPVPTGSQYFYCTLADAATQTTIEIVKVTAVSGTTFTIVRGQDGTTGTVFASGAVVSLRLVRASLNDFPKLDEVNTFSQTQTFSSAPITATLTGFVYGNGASAQTVATNAQLLTLLGTLPVGNGGTGLATLTASYVPYGTGTSALSSSANLTFSGTQLATTRLLSSGDYTANAGDLTLTNTNGGKSWRIGDGIGGFPTSLIFWDATAAAVRMAIGTSGGVSIGNTTDPGATNLSVAGKIGIGNAAPTQVLDVTGSAQLSYAGGNNYLYFISADNYVGRNGSTGDIWLNSVNGQAVILGTANTARLTVATNGVITMSAYGAGAATFSASGVISSVSDETWKIKDDIPANPDEMLQKLEPGYWFYNEEKAPIFGKDRQLGFYAQNVNAAIGSEAAPIPEEGKPWGYYDRSVLAVTVMSLKNALKTIQELNDKFDAYTASHP